MSVERLLLNALVALGVLALAGCGKSDAGGRATGASEIRIALPHGPLNLDPHLSSEVVSNTLYHHIFDPLVFMDDNLKIIPWVAESWQNPDPRTWVFKIREGILFHDGSPLTADDVEFSVQRILSLPLSGKRPLLLSVLSVAAVGDYTVKITTHEPYMPLLNKLSQVMIVPRKKYESSSLDYLRYHPVGSGPYTLRDLDFKREIVLDAFPKHWRFRDQFRRVTFRIVPDHAERARLLINHQVDFIRDVEPSLLSTIRKSNQFQVDISPGIRQVFLGFNLGGKLSDGSPNPFVDKDVRHAISMAINRAEIVGRHLDSFATPADSMIPAIIFGYKPGTSLDAYNPALAKEILRKKRFPEGFRVKCNYPEGKYINGERAFEECGKQLADVGVGLEMVPTPLPDYFQHFNGGGFDAFFGGWVAISGDASDYYEHCFHTRSPLTGYGLFNFTNYSDPGMDRLIELSSRTPAHEKRLKLLQDILVMATDELVWIPLFFMNESYAYARGLVWRSRLDGYILAFQIRTEEK